MRRQQQLVWVSDRNEELIRCDGDDFVIIPARCDYDKLEELKRAIDDILEGEK